MPTPLRPVSTACTLALALAASAQTRPLPHPLDTTTEHDAAVAAGTRARDGRPGPDAWTDHARYVIDAELDPDLALVRGQASMTYYNRSKEPVDQLVIHLRQNLHAPTALRNTEVEVTGGMKIDRLQLAGRHVPNLLDGTVLTLLPREPIAPGAEATVEVGFSFEVPAGEAPRMGREGTELYFLGYWYPQFAVRDDVDGWVAEQYLGGSEFYMPYADYEVALTLPAGWLVQATGTLQNPGEVLTEKARAALASATAGRTPTRVVTAEDLENGTATLPGRGGRLTWRFAAKNVRDFAISAASCYVWDASRAEVGDRDGDGTPDTCLVQALYRPEARTWRLATRHGKHAIEWMSRHVLPYPWPHATVVEGILGGGMEYPMITLCGDQGGVGAMQSLIAHELAHMWFPMIVGSNEKAHVWQDEGIVDFYTELIEASYWKRKKAGTKTIAICRKAAALGDDREPLMRHADYLVDRSNYYMVGYVKPAALLHQLAGMFGRERVLAALAEYADAWKYAHPRPIDFFRSMNASLGQDLDWYWSCWWAETWTLDHAVGEVRAAADHTEIVVEDRSRAFLPATVEVTYEGGETAEAVVPVATWLTGARTATLRFGPGVVRVVIDPRHTSLDVDPSNNRWSRPGR